MRRASIAGAGLGLALGVAVVASVLEAGDGDAFSVVLRVVIGLPFVAVGAVIAACLRLRTGARG